MSEFFLYAAIGFIAQMVDGLVGMGYGVTATSFLLAFGVTPALASATTHTAEVVTTGFSAVSHLGFGNVDRKMVTRLLVPGMVGAVAGAYVLVTVPGDRMRPAVAIYLAIMGVVILVRAIRGRRRTAGATPLVPLGFAGGFLDSIGGGGWGPVVVGTLLAKGDDPRTTIGSANMAEFFVTFAASLTFIIALGVQNWLAIAGLAAGGAVAAPIAAWLCTRIPTRPLLGIVGVVIILLSARTIWKAF